MVFRRARAPQRRDNQQPIFRRLLSPPPQKPRPGNLPPRIRNPLPRLRLRRWARGERAAAAAGPPQQELHPLRRSKARKRRRRHQPRAVVALPGPPQQQHGQGQRHRQQQQQQQRQQPKRRRRRRRQQLTQSRCSMIHSGSPAPPPRPPHPPPLRHNRDTTIGTRARISHPGRLPRGQLRLLTREIRPQILRPLLGEPRTSQGRPMASLRVPGDSMRATPGSIPGKWMAPDFPFQVAPHPKPQTLGNDPLRL
jgi:hypothetical protein